LDGKSKDVALDEVEHAMLDPRVAKFGQGVTSRIFLHFLSELDMSRQDHLFQTCPSKSNENLWLINVDHNFLIKTAIRWEEIGLQPSIPTF